jgi:hypothetical protein
MARRFGEREGCFSLFLVVVRRLSLPPAVVGFDGTRILLD